MAYDNDPRVTGGYRLPSIGDIDDKRMIYTVYAEDDEVEYKIPLRFGVCDVCDGHGVHVNANIDGEHGLTAEDFEDDPDFKEAYFGGAYDVTCAGCNGLRVKPYAVPAEGSAEARWLEQYFADDAEYAAVCAAERRMGA